MKFRSPTRRVTLEGACARHPSDVQPLANNREYTDFGHALGDPGPLLIHGSLGPPTHRDTSRKQTPSHQDGDSRKMAATI